MIDATGSSKRELIQQEALDAVDKKHRAGLGISMGEFAKVLQKVYIIM